MSIQGFWTPTGMAGRYGEAAREHPVQLLKRAAFVEHVGQANVSAALDHAPEINASFGGLGSEVAAEMQGKSL